MQMLTSELQTTCKVNTVNKAFGFYKWRADYFGFLLSSIKITDKQNGKIA